MRHYGMNSQDNREHNRAILLTLIRNHGPISRAELARRSGLSKPVVTEIVDSLIAANLVFESYKAKSGMGRRPMMLELSQDHLRILGIDLARTHVEFIVTDLAGHALKTVKGPLDTECDRFSIDELLEFIFNTTRDLKQEFEIIGMGVGYPLPLSSHKRVIVGSHDRPGWTVLDLGHILATELGIPVFIGNDADVAALYEKWFGVAQGLRDFIYIMIGQGVGAGIFCSDEPLLGSSGMAGEFGHILAKADGQPCVCGKKGCLETEISVNAFLTKAAKAMGKKVSTVDEISQMLACGSPLLEKVLDDYTQIAAIHIGNLVNIFNPESVIIGGEVAHLDKYLNVRLHKSMAEIVHPLLQDSFQLQFSKSPENKVAKGASVMVQQHFFAYPHKYVTSFGGD